MPEATGMSYEIESNSFLFPVGGMCFWVAAAAFEVGNAHVNESKVVLLSVMFLALLVVPCGSI